MPYIYTLTMQGNLQVFERLQKALKSSDCTTVTFEWNILLDLSGEAVTKTLCLL